MTRAEMKSMFKSRADTKMKCHRNENKLTIKLNEHGINMKQEWNEHDMNMQWK